MLAFPFRPVPFHDADCGAAQLRYQSGEPANHGADVVLSTAARASSELVRRAAALPKEAGRVIYSASNKRVAATPNPDRRTVDRYHDTSEQALIDAGHSVRFGHLVENWPYLSKKKIMRQFF